MSIAPARAPPLAIVHRDEFVVAIDKPSGLLVHRTELDRGETRFAVQLLRDQIGRHVHPVHRLDRGTSGVLLFALDRDVARVLSAQFERQQVAKRYVAIVRGHPPEAGSIDTPLVRCRDDRASWPGEQLADEPQAAVTLYRRLALAEIPRRVDRYPTSRYAMVELRPRTGRQHQIRRHLKHIAHPIVGDATYGKGRHNRLFAELFGCRRLLLACLQLELVHPASGEVLRVTAPLAADFARVALALGWEAALPGDDGAPRSRTGDGLPPARVVG